MSWINFDHTMREYHEIAEKWIEGGIIPEKEITFYCGTGWRGSEVFIIAWLMQWPNVSVYGGGWYEFSKDQNNPIEQSVAVSYLHDSSSQRTPLLLAKPSRY